MSERNAREMGAAVYGAVPRACGGASERSFDRRIKCFCACDRTCCAERDCVNRGGGDGREREGGKRERRGAEGSSEEGWAGPREGKKDGRERWQALEICIMHVSVCTRLSTTHRHT
jgi:hypothetical protein